MLDRTTKREKRKRLIIMGSELLSSQLESMRPPTDRSDKAADSRET